MDAERARRVDPVLVGIATLMAVLAGGFGLAVLAGLIPTGMLAIVTVSVGLFEIILAAALILIFGSRRR